MDSVMRESVRMNGFNFCASLLLIHPPSYLSGRGGGRLNPELVALQRRTLIPMRLSIGPELPKGTNICVDAHHINFSSELWEKPDQFDGLRHFRARQQPGNETRFKFASLGNDAPSWGDGLQVSYEFEFLHRHKISADFPCLTLRLALDVSLRLIRLKLS
jgi:hypothetical protein